MTITVLKAEPGRHFPDLDLVTQLLQANGDDICVSLCGEEATHDRGTLPLRS